eukprot:CAMPEP_0178948720 /NCGR_PEP_ID=MMETSP0789-20121207/5634_1 /TAXON_ID=3005 /ORGANISM="Rhizosolenia setigera, Strain CCMP 1694" /LENGTH=732 /DNA_ID=CAMNT_0020629127 /DNA_START=198 /DNA_END=2396 /DNA_ORIENTATION=+
MMMFTYVNSFQVNTYFSWGINTKNLHHSLPVLSSSSAATPISTKSKDSGQQEEDFQASSPEEADAFSTLAFQSLFCLLQSDLKRKGGIDGGSTGWTSWIDQHSEFLLRQCYDKITLLPIEQIDNRLKRDQTMRWMRWMKATPNPIIVELSQELREEANTFLTDEDIERVDSTRQDILQRMGMRVILLPSGASLKQTLTTPPTGGLAYGKLLYGGARRYRLVASRRVTGASKKNDNMQRKLRKVGDVTTIYDSKSKNGNKCWLQYGGSERNYEAMDIGPCALLEIYILPSGLSLPNLFHDSSSGEKAEEKIALGTQDMRLAQWPWHPKLMLSFAQENSNNSSKFSEEDLYYEEFSTSFLEMSGKERNDAFRSSFTSTVGGLTKQVDEIVRRVLDGRIISPVDKDGSVIVSETDNGSNLASLEAQELEALGLSPVRGLLLYGKPGCGKTALAREISRALRARKPKIVAALLDRWVGGSERLVRELFAGAEAELRECNGDVTKSALHVIVIDEIDAVFRKRSSTSDSDTGEATRSSVVNQILAKMDGVNAIPNVLVIGMTNRRELLDEALLRPGRLEVQIEIPTPDKEGRREILKIHFDALRRRGRLSKPLCEAIDGERLMYNGEIEKVSSYSEEKSEIDIDNKPNTNNTSKRGKKRHALRQVVRQILHINTSKRNYDLAAESVTGGFSGADIAGLVRCAGSIALSRARSDGGGVENLLITLDDVKQAVQELKHG